MPFFFFFAFSIWLRAEKYLVCIYFISFLYICVFPNRSTFNVVKMTMWEVFVGAHKDIWWQLLMMKGKFCWVGIFWIQIYRLRCWLQFKGKFFFSWMARPQFLLPSTICCTPISINIIIFIAPSFKKRKLASLNWKH